MTFGCGANFWKTASLCAEVRPCFKSPSHAQVKMTQNDSPSKSRSMHNATGSSEEFKRPNLLPFLLLAHSDTSLSVCSDPGAAVGAGTRRRHRPLLLFPPEQEQSRTNTDDRFQTESLGARVPQQISYHHSVRAFCRRFHKEWCNNAHPNLN